MTLPADFIPRIRSLGLPEADAAALLEALASSAPSVSVRLNPAKPPLLDVADATPVPWCTDGLYFPSRPKFTFDPALHQGRYYVQDASSMIIAHVLRHLTADAPAPLRYLDACAAPGGKTTAAIGALPEGSLVVANEFDFRRASILRENVAKWGYPNTVVSRGDTARFGALPGFFDIVAVDAPCSGEGMMRKDPQAVAQWSERLVDECAERQREILANLWPALRPGGYLVYSTCTFNRQENEEMVRWLIDTYQAEPVAIPVDAAWGIRPGLDPDAPAMRFLPGIAEGEGLFMAMVRKPGDAPAATPRVKSKKKQKATPAPIPPQARQWLVGDFALAVGDDGTVEALPARWTAEIEALSAQLDAVSRGVEVGTLKGRDLVPAQPLALSSALRPDAFPAVEVGPSDALAYLRRDAVTLPDSTPRGFVLATFQGHPLGFLKHLGNRSNNLYPSHWRILSKETPSNSLTHCDEER